MRLRRRMITASAIQLLALGLLLACAYLGVQRWIVPTLHDYLRVKTLDAANFLRMELDVPLAAEDPAMVREVVERLIADPDLAFIDIHAADGHEVLHHGVRIVGHTEGEPLTPHAIPGGLATWAEVSLEGVVLGRVEVGYSTARVDRVGTWARGFAAVAALVWIAAFAYTLRFSRDFVEPIRRMMRFSGKVAGGCFTEQLDGPDTGELGELKTHLNQMSRDLDSREQERQRSTARAEEMREELLTVSRMAGMAEVATGVLHNVGNVLNSINTSVSVMTSQVRASKVKALSKSLALYHDHPGGLASFLTTAKGALLPTYLEKLASQLAADNAEVQRELESVSRHVDHIATIVATQQAYTKVAALREQTDLPAVIDAALAMVQGSAADHQIAVVKTYQPLEPVMTDRHRVLQIVVNLIANARHAVRDCAAPCIGISLTRDAGTITLAVEDNGIGIPSELLAKIFQHGFTTKVDGHGFGLHSAANAATELGGHLTVASAGLSHGARFTLALPASFAKVSDAVAN